MTENFALTHLYHPGTGAKVSIPLDPSLEFTPSQAQNLVRSVDNLLLAGFTVNIPGLEDGENFEQIGFVVRREKENDDQTVTPIIDLYPAQGNFRILGIYLNHEGAIEEFENACSIRVQDIPLYNGNPIERGKSTKNDKFVVALKSPAKVVYKHNPKWEGEADKKHPKRVFVRWDGLRPKLVMTYEQACDISTPNGAKLGTLDSDKLNLLITANNSKVTPEMREAAQIVLKTKTGE